MTVCVNSAVLVRADPFAGAGAPSAVQRDSRGSVLREADLADERIGRLQLGPDRIRRESFVGIAHRDAGHDRFVVGDPGDLANDVGAS